MKYYLMYGLFNNTLNAHIYINEAKHPCGCNAELRQIDNLRAIRCLNRSFKLFHNTQDKYSYQTKIYPQLD